ncbi:hypothetical protein [Actinoplanes sp. NPDC049802]|uniref:magnesium transporter MgtE N-terminal domain-containing protein n=1 Tax=Actinoplanes sp. NPDC049802 TaxID=3154742 RepID=UPI0034057DDB
MLPGGMMPITQLAVMIRQSPPQSAISMLNGLPQERLAAVTAAMTAGELARLMLAGKPGDRARVLETFTDQDVIRAAAGITPDQAATVVAELPDTRLRRVFGELAEPVRSAVLSRLPGERRDELLSTLGGNRAHDARFELYVRAVTGALQRTNADVAVPDGAPVGILCVRAYQRLIAVAAHLGADGRAGVAAVEDAAYRLRAGGALLVTDEPVDAEVRRYCAEARDRGRPLHTVAWADQRDDGQLKRTLAALFS